MKIEQDEFNKDLDRYIVRRQKTPSITQILKNLKKEEVPEMDGSKVYIEYNKNGFWQKLKGILNKKERVATSMEEKEEIEEMEAEAEEIIEEEEALEKREQGFIAKLKQMLSRRRQAEDEEIDGQEIPPLDDEIIELVKITHKWLEELPPLKKSQFKNSGDFKRYREILKKYALIKE